MRTRYL